MCGTSEQTGGDQGVFCDGYSKSEVKQSARLLVAIVCVCVCVCSHMPSG